ncbi:serpin B10-like isoform X1 [Alligator sinensis]|uniref:Serpin B10-like isoform X1 n=2 Tax=Alligator sinensis TaxID=38654 RepID=A0A1U8DFN5_ALLSI|nr:serpin B10-like isoform X1 [Alligator sinensis]
MEALSIANTGFALDFFRQECKMQANRNILFSPLSISSTMATVYLGAKGSTAAQMAEVLHFNEVGEVGMATTTTKPQTYYKMEELLTNRCISLQKTNLDKSSNIHAAFQALNFEINKPTKNYLLRSVNQLYGEKSSPFNTEYLQSVKKYYNTEPQAVNFVEVAEEVRREINAQVEYQTEGKIQNLLPEDSVDSLTRLVLINALYFKGSWAKKFKDGVTRKQPFRINKTTTKPVQMMYQRGKFNWNYIQSVHTHVLELPYVNCDLSMFILLPKDINDDTTGLQMLERDLTYEKLAEWTSPKMMEETEVEMFLPRFKMEEGYNLKSTLSSMGMPNAFSMGKADFTGMSERNELVLSQVFHKCFVEINEEGTEAAAATSAAMMARSLMSTVQFVADHPFLFFIRHNNTKSILFFGRFCSP